MTLALGLPLAAWLALAAPAERLDPHGERAFAAYAAGDLERTEQELVLSLKGRASARAHALRGLLYTREGRPRLAAQQFRKALAVDADCSLAYEGLGRLAFHAKRTEEAIQNFRTALDRDPCNWHAMLFLAQIHRDAKRTQLAQRFLREASTLARDGEPLSAMLWFEMGGMYSSRELHHMAARAYRRSLEIDPERLESVNNLAIILIDTEQYRDAQELLGPIVQRYPERGRFHYLLGLAYYMNNLETRGESQEGSMAFMHLRRAQDLGYRPRGLTEALGWSALGAREFDLAETCFKQMLSDGINRPEAQKGLGNVYLRKRDFTRARTYFERAARDLPRDVKIPIGLATLALEEGKDEAALKKLEEALAIDPDATDALYKKGTTLMKMGRKDEAKQILARFEQLQEQTDQKKERNRNTRERLRRAQEAVDEQDYERALREIEAGLVENPDGKFLHVNHGMVLINLNRPREAVAALDTALKLDAKVPAAHNLLARAWDLLGDKKKAEEQRSLAVKARFTKRKELGAADGEGEKPR